MESIIINFGKSAHPLKSYQDAFAEQRTITIEVVKASSRNLELTDKVEIFINSWLWQNNREFKLFFTTLFKIEGMIPGVYQITLDKKSFEREMQAKAHLLPVNSLVK